MSSNSLLNLYGHKIPTKWFGKKLKWTKSICYLKKKKKSVFHLLMTRITFRSQFVRKFCLFIYGHAN
jgi:hypothetical protein